ncbi:HAMP domain-containing sensor histidine kinase [Hydrogenobacter thermophilus]|uniref:sensor histidine kinase n=1 Tax=Hydrogenobacter thermophilus TaxID=940 RepID=UPI0030FBFBA4
MKNPQSLYKSFLLSFFKFLLPIGTFFAFSFLSFRADIVDLESEYLLKTGERLVEFLSHDEDLSDNQYFGNDYIILITDQNGKVLSSNRKVVDAKDIGIFKDIKPLPNRIQELENYLVYADTFQCGTSYCRAVVALPKTKLEKRINLLLVSSVFASLVTTILIAFLSVLDIRKHLREYELYSRELKRVALYLSHEIKTPLSIILMNMPYMKAEQEVKEAVERAIRRIIKLMKNLKVLSESELKPKRLTLINIKGLMSELAQFYKTNLYGKHLTIDAENIPKVEVISDYELLYTLFLNLLDNAVKYSKENTEIKVSGQLQDGRLKMFVSNVTEEEKHLESESYGLGLTIVDEIAKRLGLHLSFRRDGSLFTAIVEIGVDKGE